MSSSSNYRNRRNSTTNTYTIGEALQDLLQTYKIKARFDEASLVASWERLMGAPIAKRTSKIYVRNKVLFVELSSAPLKHELNNSKRKVLEIISREYGEGLLEEVIFI
jgi:predicted nucleic acid-binding Zn ribbon protein